MSASFDMVVLGDINLDWIVSQNLKIRFTELQQNGVIVWAPIQEIPGGSGLNFARFAKLAGYRPLLLAKLGNDWAGRFLMEWLAINGIAPGVTIAPYSNTGKAFIMRDGNDIRFLVNNEENANRTLTTNEVDAQRDIIQSCQILYVSGYCVMDQTAPRTLATLHAMDLAWDHDSPIRCRIVFDVVPHHIYENYTFEQFKKLTERVDILVSEVATMRRFLRFGTRREIIDRVAVEETVSALKDYYRAFILRYGPSGCDEQVLWNSEGCKLHWESTGHAEALDKRGYGDQLAVNALHSFFGIKPAGL